MCLRSNQYICTGFLLYIMKKKLTIAAAVFFGLLIVTWFACRITGLLMIFSIPTPSNMPNIKPGDKVYASAFKEPVPYNFIVYTSHMSDSMNMSETAGSQYLHRLCGVPGDMIEMKNGVLYVNNKNFDKKINLNNQYQVSNAALNLMEAEDKEPLYPVGGIQATSGDSTLITLDNELLKKYGSKIYPVLYISLASDNGPFMWNNKNQTWTTDNFGPLKIPYNCYFVLGDNRHNALDSRYIGFVKKENIKGVALNK